MTSPTPNLLWQSHRVGVSFLLAETATGLTFVRIAATSTIPAHRERNLRYASEICAKVQRLASRVQPTPGEKLNWRTGWQSYGTPCGMPAVRSLRIREPASDLKRA